MTSPSYQVLRALLTASGAWCLPVAVVGALLLVSIAYEPLRSMRALLLRAMLGVTLVFQAWSFAAQAESLMGMHPAMCTEFFVLYSVMFATGPTVTFGLMLVLSVIFEFFRWVRLRARLKRPR